MSRSWYFKGVSFLAVALIAIAANYCYVLGCCPAFVESESHDCCPDEGSGKGSKNPAECVSCYAVISAEQTATRLAWATALPVIPVPATFLLVDVFAPFHDFALASFSRKPPHLLALALLEHSISPVAPPRLL
jgi:hypothetical protein